LSLPVHAQQARLEIANAKLEIGEPVTLSIACENFTPDSVPVFPSIPGLAIRPVGTSQDMIFNNGVRSLRYIISYQLVAAQAGVFQIPAVAIKSKGREYTTQPATVQAAPGVSFAYLTLQPSKTNVVLGEYIVFNLNLILDGSVLDLQNFQLSPPSGDGLSVTPLTSSKQQNIETNGASIIVLPFRFTAAPAKTGLLKLDTNTLSADLYFGPRDFFGRLAKRRHIELAFPEINIFTRPVPDHEGKSFSGAIGKFEVKGSASPLDVSVNDPITLNVEIRGSGNIENLQLPKIEWPQFQVYPPKSQFVSNDPLKIYGSQKIEVIISPLTTNVTSIPPFSLTYYDPDRNKFETVSTDPIPLRVKEGKGGPPAVAYNAVSAKPKSKPLPSLIYDTDGARHSPYEPTLGTVLALNVIPSGAIGLFSLFLWSRKRTLKDENAVRAAQLTEKIQNAEKILLNPGTLSTEQYNAEVFRFLQSGLSLVSGKKDLAITEEALEQLSIASAIDDNSRMIAAELFALCNQSRYGGAPQMTRSEVQSKIKTLAEEFMRKGRK
jgi:hypothetical protein